MKTVTRFAPSPSGELHLGGARTALFNYLYARSKKGDFRVRIEDTDQKRITNKSIDSIKKSLDWLNIKIDGDIVYQTRNLPKHKNFAQSLISKGLAYKCFADPNEVKKLKNSNARFRSEWRDTNARNHPTNKSFTVRIKIPNNFNIILKDMVQGNISVNSNEIDDYVLLRSDGSPTFLLASAVDDIEMNVTDIIRGDDHLTNSFRQFFLYSTNSTMPNFAHVPLLLNQTGEKLSKRDNVPSVLEYKEKGYLSEAIVNYLLRLGWSYNNMEILNLEFSKKVFDISNVGKSPSKLDDKKIIFLNQYYLKNLPKNKVFKIFLDYLEKRNVELLNNTKKNLLIYFSDFLKRSITIKDLYENLKFTLSDQKLSVKTEHKLLLEDKKIYKDEIISKIESIGHWDEINIKKEFSDFIKEKKISFKDIGLPIRIILTNNLNSPSVYSIMIILGKKEVLNRLIKLW